MNFKKLIISSILLTLSSSLVAQSDPWIRPGRDPRIPPSPPSSDPWSDRREDSREERREERREDRRDSRSEEVMIREYFQGQSRLDLLRDAYTRSRLQGERVSEVVITASTEMGRGDARVLVNGMSTIEGVQNVERALRDYSFRIDPFANIVGQSLRTLDLEMRGRFYVEKVVFNIVRVNTPPGPGPGHPGRPQIEVVRQQLNETIQGEGGLNLFRTFNLGAERQGQSLRKVTILARSARGNAQAQLHVNDQSSGISQAIGMNPTRLSWELSGQRIGQHIQGLRLQIRGNVVIEEVSLEIETRSAPGPGPGNPGNPLDRRIEQVINQRLYDTSGVALSQLMRIERRHEERLVESVELVLRNADMASKVKLCQTIAGQFQSVTCGNPTMLQGGSQVVRLTSLNFGKVKELSLSVRMGMIDIDRIVINLR